MKKLLFLMGMLTTSMSMMAQESLQPLETIYQKFSFTLFDKVAEDIDENVIFSPLSAQIALSMLENGAGGNTLSEIREVLGTADYDMEQVNVYNQTLTKQLTYRPPYEWNPRWGQEEEDYKEFYDAQYPICEIANGLWTRCGTPMHDSFLIALRSYYEAETAQVDFGLQESIDQINRWVSEKTHQLIPSILNEPNDDIWLLLANALYFKGSWSNPFSEVDTHVEPFHLTDGTSIDVDMMQQSDNFKTTTTQHFKTVTLPYGSGDFSMTIFLPIDEQAFPSLTYDDWQTAVSSSTNLYLKLQMPKFSIEGEYNLKDILKELGITDAFKTTADFSNMTTKGGGIDQIFQCGKIIVDEKGTEAAAVTVIEATDCVPPEADETFVIDRPFYFTIEHNITHTLLFMGHMAYVQETNKSPNGINDRPIMSPTTRHQIYDLYGRLLQQAPSKGVYIQDGKKYVR